MHVDGHCPIQAGSCWRSLSIWSSGQSAVAEGRSGMCPARDTRSSTDPRSVDLVPLAYPISSSPAGPSPRSSLDRPSLLPINRAKVAVHFALDRSQTFNMSAEDCWRMPLSLRISSVASIASLRLKTILSVYRPEKVNSKNGSDASRARVRSGASGCGCGLR